MDLHTTKINGISLCSGGAGLDIGIGLAVPGYRTVCYVEREAFACETLVSAMEKGYLDQASIWTDIKTFDGKPWRDRVHIIHSGFPCQPWSLAGKRQGTDDERWLWPDIERIICEVEPELVFLENVPGLITGGGLARVLGSLAAMGFDAEWGCVTAAAVGASHKRNRAFILAHSVRGGDQPRQGLGGICTPNGDMQVGSDIDQHSSAELAHARCRSDDTEQQVIKCGLGDPPCPGQTGADVGDPAGLRLNGYQEKPRGACKGEAKGRVCKPTGTSPKVGNAFGAGLGQVARSKRCAPRSDSVELSSRPFFPPGPGDAGGWAEVLKRWPELAPAVEPPVCGMADGLAPRVDELRLLGNGVVPLQAAYAFCTLAARLLEGVT